mgnify:CR=1 FL=1
MTAYLGLGTNLGEDKAANLQHAVDMLHEQAGHVLACSSFMETEPWGFTSDNAFLNAVVEVDTPHTPYELLHITQKIEREMGRTEKSVNGVYHDRVIDIDLLKALLPSNSPYEGENYAEGDEVVCCTETLTLPHPRMHERDFVLLPLREVETILKPLASNL